LELAKPRVDIGMSTNHLEAVLAFWQGEAGVPFDHLLPISRSPVRASTQAGVS
jgi:lactoylglutathione lyase